MPASTLVFHPSGMEDWILKPEQIRQVRCCRVEVGRRVGTSIKVLCSLTNESAENHNLHGPRIPSATYHLGYDLG